MANGQRVDPYRNYYFKLELAGVTHAAFSQCTGFGASTDPTEYREGTDRPTVRKLPGLTKFNNITLKWGLTDSRELYDWYRDVTQGKIERRDGSIVVFDNEGTEKVRWNFFDAWPAKWDAPDFDAKGTDVAIETLELAVEGIERA